MKTHLLILLACVLAVGSGCATARTGEQPVHVQVTLRAEQTIATAFEAVDAFLAYEHRHRDSLPVEVTRVADDIRRRAPGAFVMARAMLRSYQARPTPEQEIGLTEAVAYVVGLQRQTEGLK